MPLPSIRIDGIVEVQLEGTSQLTSDQLLDLIKNHPDFEDEYCTAMSQMVHNLLSPTYTRDDIFSIGTTISSTNCNR